MLDAHPELAIPPETHFLPKLIKRLREQDRWAQLLRLRRPGRRLTGKRAERARRTAHELIITHPRWPDFGLDAAELEDRYGRLEPFGATEAARAFFKLYAERAGKPRWGDKSPSYVRRMRRIRWALPEARFVHVIRDGRDVALSLMDVAWGPRTVAEAADRWAGDIRRARRLATRIEHYMEVRYEDLVGDPEPCLRRVAGFLELGWDDAMLSFHDQAEDRMSEVARDLTTAQGATISAEQRAEQHRLVARPASPSRTGRWREEMSAADRAAFEERFGGLLVELGYAPGGGERLPA